MVVQHLDLETLLSVLAPEIRDEFKRRLQDAQDLDALGTAILRFGFMGTANTQGELEDFDAVVRTFDEDEELLSLLPGIARLMARDPAFMRLSERILFTPHDRSWQVALRHLIEALEAMRRLRECVFVDDHSEEYTDTLSIIEYVERNIFPVWKEQSLTKSRHRYQRYLQTEHWRETRIGALKKAHYRCELCNSRQRLEVHHKTYDTLWRESLNDLITLCRKCHSTFHGTLPEE